MRLPVPIPMRIAVPPLFFWEKRRSELLRIACARSFHPFHPTTLLCLQLLDERLRSQSCRRLLDVGCGSGILALAASFMGVGHVLGVDISFRAIQESLANARLNGFEERTSWVVGSTNALAGHFSCIVANLRYEILQFILGDLVRLAAGKETTLILSGLHDTQWPSLRSQCSLLGLVTERVLSGDQSFFGIPPSGSFTWVAALLRLAVPPESLGEECLHMHREGG